MTCTKNSGGEVEVEKENETTYTFTMPDGIVTVNATFLGNPHTLILPDNPNGGTVTVDESAWDTSKSDDQKNVLAGQKVLLTVTPDGGYKLSNLTYTAGSTAVEITKDGDVSETGEGMYSFSMPNANTKVTVTFEELEDKTVTINVIGENGENSKTGGTVTMTGSNNQAKLGELVTLTAEPDAGYVLESLDVKAGETTIEWQTDGNVVV